MVSVKVSVVAHADVANPSTASKARHMSQGVCSAEPRKVFADVWVVGFLFILCLMGCGWLLLRVLKFRI